MKLRIIARPGSSRPGPLRVSPRGIVIGVRAAPERGRANAELIDMVARMGGVPRSAVELVAGAATRQKSLRITCADPTRVAARLVAVVANPAAMAAKPAAMASRR